jgi:hypothetical protein
MKNTFNELISKLDIAEKKKVSLLKNNNTTKTKIKGNFQNKAKRKKNEKDGTEL